MSLFSTPFDPAHDTALVTGAGNGIGRAIAQALVGEGVRTVFADVSAERVKIDWGEQEARAGGAVDRRSLKARCLRRAACRGTGRARRRHAFRSQRVAAAAGG
jgi:NAD(P)-dependent dehydrogenase (short-subunit alcohol dehydrogenase family)